jgi:hypothetical protein
MLGSSCSDSDEADPCDPILARSVTVEYDGQEETVELGDLAGELDGERCLVALPAVLQAADLGIVLAEVAADFRADDGFQPSSVECAPLDGATLELGHIDRRTGSLVWDPSLGLRGCYSVQKVQAILVEDASPLP